MSDEIGHQDASWGDLPGAVRMRFAVVQELHDVGSSMSILLAQLDELARSLSDSSARIQGVDEGITTLLASTRSQLGGLALPSVGTAVHV